MSRARKVARAASFALAVALAAALGLALSWPKLEVSPEPPIRRDQPLRTGFLVKNTGRWLTANDVRIACYVRDFRVVTGGGLHNVSATSGSPELGALDAGQIRTARCDFGPWPVQPRSTDLLILSSFSVRGLARPVVRCTRFLGDHGDGWRWRQEPCPESARGAVDAFVDDNLPRIDLTRDFVP